MMKRTRIMILLLDNYDSFTYNLAQYLGQMGQSSKCAATIRSRSTRSPRTKPERIVISPGPCTPKEAGISIPLIERFAGKIPILGVCLGHQAIGAAFGGQRDSRAASHARQDQRNPSRRQNDFPRICRRISRPRAITR